MSQYEETITNVGKNVDEIVSKKRQYTYYIEINAIWLDTVLESLDDNEDRKFNGGVNEDHGYNWP